MPSKTSYEEAFRQTMRHYRMDCARRSRAGAAASCFFDGDEDATVGGGAHASVFFSASSEWCMGRARDSFFARSSAPSCPSVQPAHAGKPEIRKDARSSAPSCPVQPAPAHERDLEAVRLFLFRSF